MSVSATDLKPMIAVSARDVITRLGLGILGAALAASAFIIWLLPAAETVPEMLLMKLGLSLAMLLGGLCALVAARTARH